jgi:hypothetical protein
MVTKIIKLSYGAIRAIRKTKLLLYEPKLQHEWPFAQNSRTNIY